MDHQPPRGPAPTRPPAAPVPDVVVWDLGRVVVQWDPYLAVAEHRTPAEWAEFVTAVDFPVLNRRQDAGRTHAEASAALRRSHPEHVATFDLYMTNFAASLPGPVPGTAGIIADLRARGVRQLGLTNWSAETFHHAEAVAPAVGLLEDVLVSGREGLTKPDRAIFDLLLARYDLDPATTVFVDDTPANVEAARAVGITAVHFTGADHLREQLHRLGLLPRTAPAAAGTPPDASGAATRRR